VIATGCSSAARRAGAPPSALSRAWRYSGEFEGAGVQAVQVIWLAVWLSAVGCSALKGMAKNILHVLVWRPEQDSNLRPTA